MSYSTDPELGQKVHERLVKLGIETPRVGPISSRAHVDLHTHFKGIMEVLGLDLADDSLADTPKRLAKMYGRELFYGLDYENFPKCTKNPNTFKVDEMVLVRGILVRSVCEHHFVPFIGHASIGYLPKDKVIGLSKFNRIVDFFSRRPQVQERLTEQLSAALQLILGTESVAVVIDAEHYCVRLRGVQDPHSGTVTSKMTGKFRENSDLRNEFLLLSKAAN